MSTAAIAYEMSDKYRGGRYSPLMRDAVIEGLPDNLRVVPHDPIKWRLWSEAVKAYRERRRRECERDVRQQQLELVKCKRDTAYWCVIWGVIFEPRSTDGKPPRWSPFILFAYQVHMIRWIEGVLASEENGRGDGIVEKSRDMGATYIFAAVATKHFLFDEVFVCGFMSKKLDDVDRSGNPGTIFYKIRALLGIEDAVPLTLRLPRFMQPPGFEKEVHAKEGRATIKNPTPGKTCYIVGETTTKLSGVSDRSTMRVVDEAARFDAFSSSWANQQATTDHRFALSTADLNFGPAFKNLADRARECDLSPELEGPSFLRLDWWIHPFHTDEWFRKQKARAMAEGDPHKFAREYEIDYYAERGAEVYPRFKEVQTEYAPYDPFGGQVYCLIDPGIRDPAGIIWVQFDPATSLYNIIESFEGKSGDDVEFYASILTGIPLSGLHQYDYSEYERAAEVMEFTASIRQPIIYIGDPAGNQRGAGGAEEHTWYKQLAMASRKISMKTISVKSITAGDARTYAKRKAAVNELLPRLRFNSNPGGARVLHCLRQYRYKKAARGYEQNEPTKPEHGPESHICTALEYGCIYFSMMQNPLGIEGRVKPTRRSLAGNLVSGRQKELFEPRRGLKAPKW